MTRPFIPMGRNLTRLLGLFLLCSTVQSRHTLESTASSFHNGEEHHGQAPMKMMAMMMGMMMKDPTHPIQYAQNIAQVEQQQQQHNLYIPTQTGAGNVATATDVNGVMPQTRKYHSHHNMNMMMNMMMMGGGKKGGSQQQQQQQQQQSYTDPDEAHRRMHNMRMRRKRYKHHTNDNASSWKNGISTGDPRHGGTALSFAAEAAHAKELQQQQKGGVMGSGRRQTQLRQFSLPNEED